MRIGERLRTAREERAVTLESMAERTRIAPRILRAIERDDFRSVPSGIFVRGYLRSYAREVGLEPEDVVAAYLAEHESSAPASVASPVSPAADGDAPKRRLSSTVSREYALIGLAIAVSLLAVYWRPVLRFAGAGDPAREGTPPRSQQQIAAQTGASATLSPPAQGAPATDAGRQQSAARTPAHSVRVTLRATGPVWVGGEADGKRVIYRLLAAKEEIPLTASEVINLKVGDAGSLLISVNGSDPAPAGAPGQVRTLSFSSSSEPESSR